MGLKKLAEKVLEYNERFESGQASEIKPDHVEKVLRKLRAKSDELMTEIASARSSEKKARLERKLAIARTQIERGEWLLKSCQSKSE
ncbi:BREX-1 system adenine-specific DNA-methyltransferase PglX [bacterium]|nr:BREX-1 system adenine-specific DNA-methyltransferase PglX [bacterium]